MNAQITPVETPVSIKTRLLAFVDILLDNSGFGRVQKIAIHELAKGYLLGRVSEEEVREQIIQFRDEVIPLILGEEVPHGS